LRNSSDELGLRVVLGQALDQRADRRAIVFTPEYLESRHDMPESQAETAAMGATLIHASQASA